MFDNDEFDRWMAQASDTLISARADYLNKSYNWCCFKAQQAAEYAVKALFEFYDEKTALEALDCAEIICDFCITMRKKYE